MASILDSIIVAPECQAEIPRTSKEKYISGYYALNIPAPEGTTGDWHDPFHWIDGVDRPKTVTLAGKGMEIDTNDVFQDFGVYEGRARLLAQGLEIDDEITEVYVANHFRAILDLLFYYLKRFKRADPMIGATNDYIDTKEQKELVLSKALLLSDVFINEARESLLKWIDSERQAC